MDGGVEYVAEIGAFERTHIFNESVDVRTPLGMFIYALYDKMEMLGPVLDLNDSSKNNIIRLARIVPDPGHKNPAAFIYGHSVFQYNNISKPIFDRITRRLEYNVSPADVLRYAQLIASLS